MQVFNANHFKYPYENLEFPGQNTEERILFVTREGKVMLYLRMALVGLVMLVIFILGTVLNMAISDYIPQATSIISLILVISIILFSLISVFWVHSLWKKSVFIITTRRLTKFIYTTPFTRYQLSLTLDKIVDTGAYQNSYFQAFTGLGYFVARSSAGNIKNFKIINIAFAEDLHNYVNKLLYSFMKQPEKLPKFRPFIPFLKGQAREEYVRKNTPDLST